jgi:transcriptional regulator GlxA family with amidase domain
VSQPLNVGILVSPGYFVCDIVGPQTVLGIQPGANLHLLWKDREPVLGFPTFPTVPTTSFADCPEELDVLAVGAMMPDVLADPEVVEFFGNAARRAEHVIAVCGGVFLAGAAGLLKGRRATTNFHLMEQLPEVGAIPVDTNGVVRDGNIWTAGPATASIEAALLVLAELRGEELAKRVELDMQYAPNPPFGTGSPALAGPELTKASLEAYAVMAEDARAALEQFRKASARAGR